MMATDGEVHLIIFNVISNATVIMLKHNIYQPNLSPKLRK